CRRLFTALESELKTHGGPYLFGELSLADLALAPTVIRLAAHEPEFGEWRLTGQWFQAVSGMEHVREWLEEAYSLPHIWQDDYLPS
ncbi:MAG: glutathione S-transferase C-terminal domain-containing protein, partial [Gammaproteobacteria bacterium]